MVKRIHLNYDFSKILSADYTAHKDNGLKHQLTELEDIHQSFGGFPKTYCAENTTIHQLWWDKDQLDFDEIGRQLGMEVITISSILQPPGNVIPYHRDVFFLISQLYPDRKEPKIRANIYLEDYKLGHLIQYVEDGVIHTSVDWKAGEGFMWDSEILHLSSNSGMQNKYTLQISGFMKD